MKTLILFDGSESSIRSIEVACQDVRREEMASGSLVIAVFGCVPYGTDLKAKQEAFEEQASILFSMASKYLQGSEFTTASGEIFLCRENRVTDILAEYFNEYQLDRMYLPAPSTYSIPRISHKTHSNPFERIFRKSVKPVSQPEVVVEGKPVAELIYPGELVKAISGKVILTDAEGIVTRLSSMNNTNNTYTAKASVLSQEYIEIRPVAVETIRVQALSFKYYLN